MKEQSFRLNFQPAISKEHYKTLMKFRHNHKKVVLFHVDKKRTNNNNNNSK